jgi:general secretion pathway protein D
MPLIRHPTRFWFSVLLTVLLGSCATERGLIPPSLELRKAAQPASLSDSAQREDLSMRVSGDTPKPPLPAKSSTVKETASAAPSGDEKAEITLMFDQLPLPNFIQVVYGNILKANFSVDAQVAARTDLVTLRTSSFQTPSQVRQTAKTLLKSYGIAVTDVGNFLRIVPDNTMQGYAPQIRRGRALPETPLPLRPIFQLVELDAVLTGEVSAWLGKMYGQKLTIQDDGARNALMISGQSEDVISAMETIRVLDQPRMRGQHSTRIDPMFWSAQEMSNKLNEILSAEGYRTAITAAANTPIIVLPIQAINAIIVFAGDPAIISHVVDWAKELDKPASKGGGFFTYQARYTDAQPLANTVRELLANTGTTPAAGAGAASGLVIGPAQAAKSRVVVSAATNSLIFQGGMEDYTSILNLLQQLDQPVKAALIEVTVAEVNLTDAEQLGVEWTLNAANTAGAIWTAGTLGGLGIATAGLNIGRSSLAGSPRMLINALATNNRARILSSPRILARNGETATIQVGQEVPIITSQQTTPVASPVTGVTSGILQTVQYRTTGVILKVKPVIHAGDRIELEVSQEVSAAASTTTGVNTSPTFSSRKVETKLSLKDGATVLLGGLMSSTQSKNQGGVPLLKDIPGFGQLFRVDNENNSNTELIVLITPYIISDDKDAEAITDAFRNRLGDWARNAPPPNARQGEVNPPSLKGSTPNMAGENQALPLKPATSLPNANSPPTTGSTPATVTKP